MDHEQMHRKDDLPIKVSRNLTISLWPALLFLITAVAGGASFAVMVRMTLETQTEKLSIQSDQTKELKQIAVSLSGKLNDALIALARQNDRSVAESARLDRSESRQDDHEKRISQLERMARK